MYEEAVKLTYTVEDKIRVQIELDNARSNLFDQWHFPMLNDKRRNTQFASAIKCQIQKMVVGQKPIHVVDLGCGTGILAAMCARELQKQFGFKVSSGTRTFPPIQC